MSCDAMVVCDECKKYCHLAHDEELPLLFLGLGRDKDDDGGRMMSANFVFCHLECGKSLRVINANGVPEDYEDVADEEPYQGN